MLKVRTSSGKEFNIDHCVLAVYGIMRMLYIEFIGYSMAEIFPVFSNNSETSTIYALEGDKVEHVYSGYVNVKELFQVPDTNDHVRIRLEPNVSVERFG